MINEKSSINKYIDTYLLFCRSRKNLDNKSLKSYSIDLQQFLEYLDLEEQFWLDKDSIECYINHLHQTYKPKSVKRKIASLKAFYHFLEIEEIIEANPFHKIQVKYKEPFILPKTIPINIINEIIQYAYSKYHSCSTDFSKKNCLRNVVILELLFATGMRISELCSLSPEQIDTSEYIIKIYGKGSKERLIQICNHDIQNILKKYMSEYEDEIKNSHYLFVNRQHKRLSEQSVRNMIRNYSIEAGISLHITPHMFRHSFATLLLEEDVDIRYIQQMLGHSSITTTQIYTHTSISKQKSILSIKHPRNKLTFNL